MNRLKRQVLVPLQSAFVNTSKAILDFAEAMGLIKPDLFTKSLDELNTSLDEQNEKILRNEKNIKRFGEIPEYTRPLKAAKEQKALLEDAIAKREKQIEIEKKLQATQKDGADSQNNINNTIKESILVTKDFADTVEGQLTNAFKSFFDIASQQFLDFKDLATSIARAVINELINVFIIQKAVGMVKGKIGDIQSAIEYNRLSDGDTLFQSSNEGGGFTGMGVRAGGIDGRGGFPAILHPNETVIDHTKGQGMGATVNFNISTVDAAGFDQLLASRKGLITSIINNAMNNQGKMGVV